MNISHKRALDENADSSNETGTSKQRKISSSNSSSSSIKSTSGSRSVNSDSSDSESNDTGKSHHNQRGDSNSNTAKNRGSRLSSMDPEEGLSVANGINPVVISSSSSSNNNSSSNDSSSDEELMPSADYAASNESESESDMEDPYDIEEYKFFDEEDDDKGLDYDFDHPEMIDLSEIQPTRKISLQLRRFLKLEGHDQFIKYFISSSSPHHLVHIINLLGYRPVHGSLMFKTKDQSRLSLKFLERTFNTIYKSRIKLSNFHTIDHLVNAIDKASNILVLTGAGISTSLGIPDFRSNKGIYSMVKDRGLDDPQDVFNVRVFEKDPSIFYSVAHMILPPEDSFTPLHSFIKLLQDKDKLLRNYTQNIDNIEGYVGLSPDKVIQCHGSFATASCFTCKYKIPGKTLIPSLRKQQIAYCPFCANERRNKLKKFEELEDEGGYSARFSNIESFGVMKPDITFFHENLPDKYHKTIKQDILKCDLLICIGTSLKVAPVSEIVNLLPNNVPQILINRDPIDHCNFDIEMLGYCDQVVSWICNADNLNWSLKHKDFDKISNSGLQLHVIDEVYGRYRVTDAAEREKIKQRIEEHEAIKTKFESETQDQKVKDIDEVHENNSDSDSIQIIE